MRLSTKGHMTLFSKSKISEIPYVKIKFPQSQRNTKLRHTTSIKITYSVDLKKR